MSKTDQTKEFVTVAEAAKMLKVHVITIRRAIKDGRLSARNVSFGPLRPTYALPKKEVEDLAEKMWG